MAIIDDAQTGTPQEGTGSRNENFQKFNPDDPNFMASFGAAESYDTTADPYARVMPPPKGVVGFKMYVNKEGYRAIKDDPGHFIASFDCKIVEFVSYPQLGQFYDNYVVDHSFTSIKYRGKRTSTAAHLVAKFAINASLDNTRQLIQGLQMISKRELVVYGMLNWKAGCAGLPGQKWDNVFYDYDEFPDDPLDRSKKQWINIPYQQGNKSVKLSAFPYFSEIYGKERPVGVSLKGRGQVVVPSVVMAPPPQPLPHQQPQQAPSMVIPPSVPQVPQDHQGFQPAPVAPDDFMLDFGK